MQKEDKDQLAPLLDSFKLGYIDLDYTIDYILHLYKMSRSFNWNNFLLGMSIGGILMYIFLQYAQ